MRKKIVYIYIFIAFSILGYFTYDTFSISKEDTNLYHELLNRKSALTSCEALKKKPLLQTRKEVQKDIFLTQNKSRLHFRICSEKSFVKLTEKKDNIEFIEDLDTIKCFFQDRISFDSQTNSYNQQLRCFTADKGTYVYPSHKFSTDSINLSFLEIPGNNLPDSIDHFPPHLKGFAKEVSFILTDKSPQLNASHFRACFDLDKEIP